MIIAASMARTWNNINPIICQTSCHIDIHQQNVPVPSTHTDLSTSMVKSTWPYARKWQQSVPGAGDVIRHTLLTGVSIKLMLQSSHMKLMAAEDMVIPRSRSWGRKSMTVFPLSTRPTMSVAPLKKRNCSVVVVFPASMCATMPTFRIFAIDEVCKWRKPKGIVYR